MKRPRIEILEAALQAVDSADDAMTFSELLDVASHGGAFDDAPNPKKRRKKKGK